MNATSIENLARSHLPMLIRVAYRILGSAADAEEAVQDSFLEVVQKSKRTGKPFLPGSVVLWPVNSGLGTFSDEVRYERAGAGLA